MHHCSKHRSPPAALLLVLFATSFFALKAPLAFAQQVIPSTGSTFEGPQNTTLPTTAVADTAILSNFYTIDESQLTAARERPRETTDLSPMNLVNADGLMAYARTLGVSLLRWIFHAQSHAEAPVKYDRKLHFGRWINDPNDETCYNTRARVLIRDSEGKVSFKDSNHCVVEKGRWSDPYAGGTLHESKEIQIDHMVPLKNAYISGAWAWSFQSRCTYANYMGNTFHLITASGHENMSKGDDTPANYIPPNEAYRCEYLENWLKIKLIWKLKMVKEEVEAIRQAIKDSGCDPRRFAMSAVELQHQRDLIYENRFSCPDR